MLQSLRPFGAFGLGQASTVQAQITAAANQYGVPPALALAVAKQESGYNQTGPGGGTLTSSAGALGVMQLMPATAAGLGVDPTDQTQNINGGVKLLSQLLTQFGGNTEEALAAYNAGPTAVIKAGGVPNIPETQNYVSSIMANYQSSGSQIPSSTTDGDTPDATTGTFDLASLTSSIDLTDPTTLAVIGAATALVLYAVL